MKQITLVTQARAGVVADISERLGREAINIETLEAFELREWDIVQLSVSDYNRALGILRDAGYEAIAEDAVVIKIKDQPGALANVTRRLYEGRVEIRSVRVLHRQGGEAMVAITMDRPHEGMRLIEDLLVNRSTE